MPSSSQSRRNALKCLAYGGAGTLFTLAGGIFTPVDLAHAASAGNGPAVSGKPLFLQISDTHIGFNKDANPDVPGTLKQTIDLVNAMPEEPALVHPHRRHHPSVEGGGIRSRRSSCSRGCEPSEMHTMPGEHDVTDGTGARVLQPLRQAPRTTRAITASIMPACTSSPWSMC